MKIMRNFFFYANPERASTAVSLEEWKGYLVGFKHMITSFMSLEISNNQVVFEDDIA